MKIIKIKKSGKIFLEELMPNGKIKSRLVNDLKSYLACDVEFGSGLTFESLFKLIVKDKDVFNIIFNQELNGIKLEDLEKDLANIPKDFKDNFKIEYLEVSKVFEFFELVGNNVIELFPVFMGFGKTNDEIEINIPLNVYSIGELKNFEVLTNKTVKIYRSESDKFGELINIVAHENMDINDDELNDYLDDGLDDDYDDEADDDFDNPNSLDEENIDGRPVYLSKITTGISLYEAIQSIIFEVAYFKTSDEKIKARESVNSEYMYKNKILLLESQLKNHIDNDEFESAAIVKEKIDKLNQIADDTNK